MRFLNGAARAGGFMISFWDVRRKVSFYVESKGYSHPQRDKLNVSEFFKEIFFWFRWLVAIPLAVYFSFFWQEDIWRNIVSLGALVFFILTLATAVTHLRPMFQSKKARQWHNCEHKLLNLVKHILSRGSGEDLTIENLKAANRICLNCLTTFHIFFVLTALLLFIIILVVPIDFHDLLMYGLIIYLGARNCFLILLIFFLSSSLIISLLQYLFFTAEPTKGQLEETIEVGKEFLRKYNQILNNQKLL